MDSQLLNDVKSALGITGNFQNETLQGYCEEVVSFLLDAGVKRENISNGVVARGVADLWNYGSGDGKLSEYFKQRAVQLSYKK
ncbi:MAG: hypothetical protein J6S67_25500 [Methanobrevibacter sp.]|nr:hypothetical protein [Methanobrevibacter sp.]